MYSSRMRTACSLPNKGVSVQGGLCSDASKNITLPQISFADGNKIRWRYKWENHHPEKS